MDPVSCMIKLYSNNTAYRGLHSGEKCDKQCNQLCPLDKADVLQEACAKYCLGRRQRKSKRRIIMKLYLNQSMDKLLLGCQSSSGIGIGSDICDDIEVVMMVLVVGSDGVIGSDICDGLEVVMMVLVVGSDGVIGSDICDGLEEVVMVLVVGSGGVIGSSDCNIYTQLLLKFTTVYCTVQ